MGTQISIVSPAKLGHLQRCDRKLTLKDYDINYLDVSVDQIHNSNYYRDPYINNDKYCRDVYSVIVKLHPAAKVFIVDGRYIAITTSQTLDGADWSSDYFGIKSALAAPVKYDTVTSAHWLSHQVRLPEYLVSAIKTMITKIDPEIFPLITNIDIRQWAAIKRFSKQVNFPASSTQSPTLSPRSDSSSSSTSSTESRSGSMGSVGGNSRSGSSSSVESGISGSSSSTTSPSISTSPPISSSKKRKAIFDEYLATMRYAAKTRTSLDLDTMTAITPGKYYMFSIDTFYSNNPLVICELCSKFYNHQVTITTNLLFRYLYSGEGGQLLVSYIRMFDLKYNGDFRLDADGKPIDTIRWGTTDPVKLVKFNGHLTVAIPPDMTWSYTDFTILLANE